MRLKLPRHAFAPVAILIALSTPVRPSEAETPRIRAVAFDAFVIFNANSIEPEIEKIFPEKGEAFAAAWRARQFDYSFLHSITGEQEDFLKITGDALDYTAEQMHLALTPQTRAELMNAYLNLQPWPDAAAGLKRLREAGIRVILLSNFSPEMLRGNLDHAGMTGLFDAVVNTQTNGSFKPEPRAYALGMSTLRLRNDEIVFAAFGGWDAYGAKHFGYRTYWVNRFHLPQERLGAAPDATSAGMEGLVDFVLGTNADNCSRATPFQWLPLHPG